MSIYDGAGEFMAFIQRQNAMSLDALQQSIEMRWRRDQAALEDQRRLQGVSAMWADVQARLDPEEQAAIAERFNDVYANEIQQGTVKPFMPGPWTPEQAKRVTSNLYRINEFGALEPATDVDVQAILAQNPKTGADIQRLGEAGGLTFMSQAQVEEYKLGNAATADATALVQNTTGGESPVNPKRTAARGQAIKSSNEAAVGLAARGIPLDPAEYENQIIQIRNAAMTITNAVSLGQSIMMDPTSDDYDAYLAEMNDGVTLAEASGLMTPERADKARSDLATMRANKGDRIFIQETARRLNEPMMDMLGSLQMRLDNMKTRIRDNASIIGTGESARLQNMAATPVNQYTNEGLLGAFDRTMTSEFIPSQIPNFGVELPPGAMDSALALGKASNPLLRVLKENPNGGLGSLLRRSGMTSDPDSIGKFLSGIGSGARRNQLLTEASKAYDSQLITKDELDAVNIWAYEVGRIRNRGFGGRRIVNGAPTN